MSDDHPHHREAELDAWLSALNLAAAGVHGATQGFLQRECGWEEEEAEEQGARLRDCTLTAGNALRHAEAGLNAIYALANAVAQQGYNDIAEIESKEAADRLYSTIYDRITTEDAETPGFSKGLGGGLLVPATEDGRTIQ